MPTPISNAGLYGASATLPSSAGGTIEPPILTSGGGSAPYYASWDTPPIPYYGDPSGAGMVSSTLFGNNSGSASQPGYDIAGFGNNYGLGNDLYASLDSMGYGDGYGGYAAGGYDPSSVMQGYLDFYKNDPSASGATAPSYPAPGTGGQPQSLISRLINHTPQGMLRNAIGNAIRSNQARANMQPNRGSWQGPPAIPPGGALFGYNPAQGGGTPHYDPATGRTTATPSLNPLYTTGGGWQPVANAPTDIRFSQNSGTGNFVADQTTKNFLAGGGYAGVPNQAGPDSTNRFYGAARSVDSQGGYGPAQPAADFNPADMAAKTALYNQAVQSLPYQQGEGGASYTKRVNDWIAQRNGSQSIQTLLAKLYPNGQNTISGPPALPGGG